MINKRFQEEILLGIKKEHVDYHCLKECMLRFKDMGMNQQEMYDNLDAMRSIVDTEEQEDAVKDLMDFVVGYCHPSWHIYPKKQND